MTSIIYDITDNDILSGKSKLCLHHVGSKRFRSMIESYRHRYALCDSKYSKMMITKEIYETMQTKTCRFLRYRADVQGWEEIPQMQARDKIGHSLRFANRSTRRRRGKQSNNNAKDSDVCDETVSTVATTGSASLKSQDEPEMPPLKMVEEEDSSALVKTFKATPSTSTSPWSLNDVLLASHHSHPYYTLPQQQQAPSLEPLPASFQDTFSTQVVLGAEPSTNINSNSNDMMISQEVDCLITKWLEWEATDEAANSKQHRREPSFCCEPIEYPPKSITPEPVAEANYLVLMRETSIADWTTLDNDYSPSNFFP